VLGLIYIFIVAKPISIRRLALLFVVTLFAARCLYSVMHVANPPSASLATAIALTIVAWLTPLGSAVASSVKSRRLILGALDSASGTVRITYGSALAALLLVASQPIANAMHRLTFGMLLQTLLAGGLIGIVSLTSIRSFRVGPSESRHPRSRFLAKTARMPPGDCGSSTVIDRVGKQPAFWRSQRRPASDLSGKPIAALGSAGNVSGDRPITMTRQPSAGPTAFASRID
jgi:hypothetical protein